MFVTNKAPFMPFRVILVIESQHKIWTNMIVKMTILRLLGSSDDKEKEKIGVGAALRALLRLSSLSLCHHLNLKS